MQIIESSYEILNVKSIDDGIRMLKDIEQAARTCYQSGDKITDSSYAKMVKMLVTYKHDAMLEFGGNITVRFIVDRGLSHELCRHRLCSVAQESTRYVSSVNGIDVVCPIDSDVDGERVFLKAMHNAEDAYKELIALGFKPQIARSVLPTALKTEINISANIREWRHIFTLRTAHAAHPQMREVMIPLLNDLQKLVPIVFDDICKYG